MINQIHYHFEFELSTDIKEEADEICAFIDYLRNKYPPKEEEVRNGSN
jgi:hypothetical protein